MKGRHFTYYSRVNAPVYKFAADPGDADMRGYIETALDELGLETVPPDSWRPAEVKVARHKVSTSSLLGRRFVPRRITKGWGLLEDSVAEPELDHLGLTPALRGQLQGLSMPPTGFMWAALLPGLPGQPTQAVEVAAVEGGRCPVWGPLRHDSSWHSWLGSRSHGQSQGCSRALP